MLTFELIDKTREYLDYIEGHVMNVHKAWKELQVKCSDMRFIYDDYVYRTIESEVERHDLSKLSEDEFVQYREFFYPCADEKKKPLGKFWEHHKNNNQHHWENWTVTCNSDDPHEWEVHCVHMVIDWMAMGYQFGDTSQQYYEANKDKIKLPEYAVKFIYEIFERIDA